MKLIKIFLLLALAAHTQALNLHCYVCDGEECNDITKIRQENCGPQQATTPEAESTGSTHTEETPIDSSETVSTTLSNELTTSVPETTYKTEATETAGTSEVSTSQSEATTVPSETSSGQPETSEGSMETSATEVAITEVSSETSTSQSDTSTEGSRTPADPPITSTSQPETSTTAAEISSGQPETTTGNIAASTGQSETTMNEQSTVEISQSDSTTETSDILTITTTMSKSTANVNEKTTDSAGTSTEFPQTTEDSEEDLLQEPNSILPSAILINNYRRISRSRRNADDLGYSCYSVEFKDNDQRKINKGCVSIPTDKSACEVVAEKVSNVIDGSCKVCMNDLCNSSSVLKLSVLTTFVAIFIKFLM